MSIEIKKENHDPYAALRLREFRMFLSARFLLTLSIQIQAVVVGWHVFQLTHDPFSLGLIGLAEAIPAISIALFGGHLADSFSRKKIILLCCLALVAGSFALFFWSRFGSSLATKMDILFPIYLIIFMGGFARGIIGPAIFSFWPQLLTDKVHFNNAVTWNTSVWQIASTTGPALGGLLIIPLGIANAYLADAILLLISISMFLSIKNRPVERIVKGNFWQNLTEGIKFVFANQIILSALTLDLFAVLFGGAIALLPVFASDILNVGVFEFGLLKAATGIGAVLTGLSLAFIPIRKNAGKLMLASVAGFALCMIAFSLSIWFWFSFLILLLSGVFDGVSVVIRGTLVQTHTPDNMKGRVSAVNNIFIGSSNEIGAFESGLSAKFLGVVPSVLMGGIISLFVVGVTTLKAKQLREMDL
jgi:MFS family permease